VTRSFVNGKAQPGVETGKLPETATRCGSTELKRVTGEQRVEVGNTSPNMWEKSFIPWTGKKPLHNKKPGEQEALGPGIWNVPFPLFNHNRPAGISITQAGTSGVRRHN